MSRAGQLSDRPAVITALAATLGVASGAAGVNAFAACNVAAGGAITPAATTILLVTLGITRLPLRLKVVPT